MIAAPTAPVHWTTYAALIVSVLSMVGTFVYVAFTYHIMKWAVGQGQAARDVAKLSSEQEANRRLVAMDKVAQFCGEAGQEALSLIIECQRQSPIESRDKRTETIERTRKLCAGIDKLLELQLSLATRQALFNMRSEIEMVPLFQPHSGDALNHAEVREQHESVIRILESFRQSAETLWGTQYSVNPLTYNDPGPLTKDGS